MPFFVTPNGHWLFIGRGKSDDRILTAVEKQRYDTLIMATTLAQVNELEPRIGKGLNANTKRVLLNNLPDQRAEAKYVIDDLMPTM